MPGTLRASWEATVPHYCDPFWMPTAPSYPSRPGRGVFLEASHSSRSTAFFNIPGINKGIDEDQRTEYGEPFIGNTDAGTVFGPANLMSMGKKRLQGFLKKRLQKAVVDELEMDVNAADLDPLTDNAEAYAVSAQTAAWKATRAAEQSLPREAGLDRIPAKVDYAWKAALQATRMAHSQRLVDQQLNITRQDRRQVSAAVDELVGNIADAVEQKDPVQQGVAVEAVKRNLAMVQDLQDTVEEDFDKLEKEQKLLEAELQEAQKYPLYPSRDYVVASVPEPGEPPPPEIVIGSMDTDVPKVEET